MISEAKIVQLRSLPFFILIVSPFITLATWNIWTPYSYWFDELFSVVANSKTWHELMNTLLNDVHPPLYQVILKIWIAMFGNGEVETRALSLIFSLAALALLGQYVQKKSLVFALTVMLIFASSWLFPYYAQETRSYSMLLFLGTLATLFDLQRDEQGHTNSLSWYLVLLLLSLTHYFGLLYAGLLLLGDIYRERKSVRKQFLSQLSVGALMLVWPILHMAFGDLGVKASGNFWIQVNGMQDTLSIFLSAMPGGMPRGLSLGNIQMIFLLIIPWAIFLVRGVPRYEMRVLLVRIVGFVGIVAMIDLHTPISTTRNYIVLLPAIALLFGYSVEVIWGKFTQRWLRVLLGMLAISYFSLFSLGALLGMDQRWMPRQNWKVMANIVESTGICQPHCWFLLGPSSSEIHSFYFKSSMGSNSSNATLTLTEILNLSDENRLPIIAAHVDKSRLDQLRERYEDWKCLRPQQAWRNDVMLFVPPSKSLVDLSTCH